MDEKAQRPIEKQLEAWAQERRAEAGPPFELDPIRRRELQEEVARLQPGEAMPGRPLWQLLLPRLAVGAALAGLLMLAIVQMGSRDTPRQGMQLALHDASLEAATPAARESAAASRPAVAAPEPSADALAPMAAPQPAPRSLQSAEEPLATARQERPEAKALAAPAPVKQEAVRLADSHDDRRDEPVNRALGRTAPVSRASPEARVATAAPGSAPASEVVRSRYGLSASPKDRVLSQPGPAASPPSAIAGVAAQTDSYPATQYGTFAPVQRLRQNFNSPPQRVLVAFSVEEEGTQVRVRDQDGSVYVGVRLAESAVSQDKDTGRAAPLAVMSAGAIAQTSAASNGFTFEVRGTNSTTGEPVVFRAFLQQAPSPSVQGTATLGTRSRMGVDAVQQWSPPPPAAPPGR